MIVRIMCSFVLATESSLMGESSYALAVSQKEKLLTDKLCDLANHSKRCMLFVGQSQKTVFIILNWGKDVVLYVISKTLHLNVSLME